MLHPKCVNVVTVFVIVVDFYFYFTNCPGMIAFSPSNRSGSHRKMKEIIAVVESANVWKS